jgi:transcriptional regulator with XRE-family HTH domain
MESKMSEQRKSSPEFGERLKKLRKQAQMSVEKVAMLINVAPSTYREWENGRAISGNPYVQLARAFNVSLPTLFGVSEPTQDEITQYLNSIQQTLNEIRLRL